MKDMLVAPMWHPNKPSKPCSVMRSENVCGTGVALNQMYINIHSKIPIDFMPKKGYNTYVLRNTWDYSSVG